MEQVKFFKGPQESELLAKTSGIEEGAIYHCLDSKNTYLAIGDGDSSKLDMYSSAVGKTVGETGEIFNNYERNHALGMYSHAEGCETIASGKIDKDGNIIGRAPGNSCTHAEGYRTSALGPNSHAEGLGTLSEGETSHAEGYKTVAQGKYSHAEGEYSKAQNQASHAEGGSCLATGLYSHAEGCNSGNTSTTASGVGSHAEGWGTSARGDASHAEGELTVAYLGCHAEGQKTTAGANSSEGAFAHAEGISSAAPGKGSHAEGESTLAQAKFSHAEGGACKALGNYSHVEGCNYANTSTITTENAEGAHAEGRGTTAKGTGAHSEGCLTIAEGNYSHAEGCFATVTSGDPVQTIAFGLGAHAEGAGSQAIGSASHAEGVRTVAGTKDNPESTASHAEGSNTIALGNASHAEGMLSKAEGTAAHAEGYNTQAKGYASHAEGIETSALGNYSHAEGEGTIAQHHRQHVQGRYNEELEEAEAEKYAHIVGGGSWNDGNPIRKNIHTVDWDGNAWFAGNIYIGGTGQNNTSAQPVTTAADLKPLLLDDQMAVTYETDPAYGDSALDAILKGRQILITTPSTGGFHTKSFSPVYMYQLPNRENGFLYLFYLTDEKDSLDLSTLGLGVFHLPKYAELKMKLSKEYNECPLQ